MTETDTYLDAALKLYCHLFSQYWTDGLLVGPDPIGKINWRVTRFIKGYLPWLPWADCFAYMQTQGYWIQSNVQLFALTQDSVYLDRVEECADTVIRKQNPDGTWMHPPLQERQNFVSAVESVWAGLSLATAYKKLQKNAYLEALIKTYDGLVNKIGLRTLKDSLAVNYYAHANSLVPNVTTMFLWLVAELHILTSETRFLKHTNQMIRFLAYSQLPTGELQYSYAERPHFQCYQYNSFQFLDLLNYYRLTKDEQVYHILTKMAHFLASGLTKRGSCRYDCFKENPETNYWTAALAAALFEVHRLEIDSYQNLSEQAYQRLLTQQNSNGSFYFSDKNYRFFADRRSYPRQQAMILMFLLTRTKIS